jgi:hypothetical protein
VDYPEHLLGAKAAKEIPGGGGDFHIVVLQHTDCGITRLADTDMLRAISEYREANSEQKESLIPERRSPPTLPRSGDFGIARQVACFRPCL